MSAEDAAAVLAASLAAGLPVDANGHMPFFMTDAYESHDVPGALSGPQAAASRPAFLLSQLRCAWARSAQQASLAWCTRVLACMVFVVHPDCVAALRHAYAFRRDAALRSPPAAFLSQPASSNSITKR